VEFEEEGNDDQEDPVGSEAHDEEDLIKVANAGRFLF